jgi:hypothetical protein
LNKIEIEHALSQILPGIEAVRGSAGEMQLDEEMMSAVEKTLSKILKKRLAEKKKPHF